MFNTLRRYKVTDLEAIVAVTNAAALFDATENGTSVLEMTNFFMLPGLVPAENAFVVEEDGRIVAFAFLNLIQDNHECSFRVWFQVHPVRRGRGLGERLLARLYERAQERLPECKTDLVKFSTHADMSEHDRIAILERSGLEEVRRGWTMVRPTLDDIPTPHYPEGIRIRAYRVGEDDPAAHQLDNEVFRDHWGHVDYPFELWEHYLVEPGVRPDLSLVAENGATGELAGFCMLAIRDEENKRLGTARGWIDILGVRRAYRRRGLGTALVLAGLEKLREAGMAQAVLGADSENLTGATRIYERVGFRVHRTRIIFSKTMREPQNVRAYRQAQTQAGLKGP